VGGIIGYADFVTVRRANATTLADNNLIHSTGGIGGCVGSTVIRDSFATATLTAYETLGGILGWAGGGVVIERSASHAMLNGGNKVGGLVGGYYRLTATNTYATGTIEGNARVGGLVGGPEWEDSSIGVTNSYAAVLITAVDEDAAGGLIGQVLEDTTATVTDSFWDTTVSDFDSTAGDLGDGVTTEALKTLSTFVDAGWNIVQGPDSSYIWGISDDTNSGYPFLQVRDDSDPEPEPEPDPQPEPENPTNNGDSGGGNTDPSPSGNTTPAPAQTPQEKARSRKLMESLAPSDFAKITPAQLAQLPLSAIRGITTQHTAVMTRDQFMAFTPAQLRVLRPATLASLSPDWLQRLSYNKVKWLLPRQIRALSPKQLEKFTAKERSAMSAVMRKSAKQVK